MQGTFLGPKGLKETKARVLSECILQPSMGDEAMGQSHGWVCRD